MERTHLVKISPMKRSSWRSPIEERVTVDEFVSTRFGGGYDGGKCTNMVEQAVFGVQQDLLCTKIASVLDD